MKCSRPRCRNVVDTKRRKYRLCRKHWDVSTLPAQRVDAGPAKAHVQSLLDLRWSFGAIAAASGVSRTALRAIHSVAKVQRFTEAAILAVPLVRYSGRSIVVDATGTRRRIEALAYLGHPLISYELRLGRCRGRVGKAVATGWVSAALADAMVRVYRDLENTIGPSDIARRRAQKLGFAGPAAWDDRDIDDPAAVPLRPFRGLARSA